MVSPPTFPLDIPDGRYWGFWTFGTGEIMQWLDEKYEPHRIGMTFQLTSAAIADSCSAHPVPNDDCTVVVDAQAQARYPGFLDTLESVIVINGKNPSEAFQVTPEIFGQLVTIAGGPLPDGKPDGYWYFNYPFLLTIRNGSLVAVEQLYLDPSLIVYQCDDPKAIIPSCDPLA